MTAPQRLNKLQEMNGKSPGTWDRDALLHALLQDESDVVRHEAAFILGDLKRACLLPEETEKSVFEALLSATADKSVLVRHEAALSLAKFPGELSINALCKLCADPAPEVVSSARYALIEMLGRSPK